MENLPLPVEKHLLREWIHNQKTQSLNKDGRNAVERGKNWSVFDFCNQYLQTKEALEEAVVDLLSRLSTWNVIYAEIRFCPELHTAKGLTLDEVVKAAIGGAYLRGGLVLQVVYKCGICQR